MDRYRHDQLTRVSGDEYNHGAKGDGYLYLKVRGDATESHWLTITPGEVEQIAALLLEHDNKQAT